MKFTSLNLTATESLAESIKIKIRLLRDEIEKEMKYQKGLSERQAGDSFPMGSSIGKELQLRSTVRYLEDIVRELIDG